MYSKPSYRLISSCGLHSRAYGRITVCRLLGFCHERYQLALLGVVLRQKAKADAG